MSLLVLALLLHACALAVVAADVPTSAQSGLKHVVFISVSLPGHLNPLIAMAKELHARGWRVTVGSSERARAHVEGQLSDLENARFLSCGVCEEDDNRETVFESAVNDPSFKEGSRLVSNWMARFWTCMYDGFLEPLRQDRPQGIVADSFTFAAFDLARSLGVDYILSWPFTLSALSTFTIGMAPYLPTWTSDQSLTDVGLSLSSRFLSPLLQHVVRLLIQLGPQADLDQLRSVRGLAPSDWVYAHAGRMILVTSAWGLEYARPLPPLVQLVGSTTKPSTEATLDLLSSDERDWLQGDLPVVYICLGTLWQASQWHVDAFVATTLAGLGRYRVLWKLNRRGFSLLPNRSTSGLDDSVPSTSELAQFALPPNVRVVDWVSSQQAVLHHPNVRAFISHCGHNGVYEAVLARTPLLCIPSFADQLDEAHRVVDAGIGVKVKDKMAFSAAELHSLLQTLLLNRTHFDYALQRARSTTLLAGGVTRAASLIEHAFTFGVKDWTTLDTNYPWYAFWNIDVLVLNLLLFWSLWRFRCCGCRFRSPKAKHA